MLDNGRRCRVLSFRRKGANLSLQNSLGRMARRRLNILGCKRSAVQIRSARFTFPHDSPSRSKPYRSSGREPLLSCSLAYLPRRLEPANRRAQVSVPLKTERPKTRYSSLKVDYPASPAGALALTLATLAKSESRLFRTPDVSTGPAPRPLRRRPRCAECTLGRGSDGVVLGEGKRAITEDL
jgi:hypothetical protein